jgi:HKD family nuclease
MKTGILIEELKERMAGQKVRAALFYTFNFDARFFENYILTQFLSDVSFSNNEIQNAILWKKYQNELPPITVFCDFHAKGTTGPSLAYNVVPVDMPTNDSGRKPCFHPKQSYILLEDSSLIVIGGSNNITQSAWCSNIECVNVFHFTPHANKNIRYFPRTLKDRFKNLCRNVRRDVLTKEHITESEQVIENFFKSIKYTEEAETLFFNSGEEMRTYQEKKEGLRSFDVFIDGLKQKYNGGEPFVKAEVISPYYSTGLNHFDSLSEVLGTDHIKFSVPFENTDYVALDESIYRDIEESYGWGRCSFDNGKAFRFNHSKVYRLLGNETMISIVGSVNCTDAAFRGVADGGNYETAIAYVNDAAKWVDQLEEVDDGSFTFTEAKEEEGYEDNRLDAFNLEFTLNWNELTLTVKNNKPTKQKGRIVLEGVSDKYLSDTKTITTIILTPELVAIFADNSLIKLKPSGIDGFLYYYPTQIGIELKPFSSKYNLNDAELLELWQELDEANDKESMGRLIDRFVDRITDEFEEEKEDELDAAKSSINFMASHLSGLLKLKEKLFMELHRKTDQEIQKRRISYYLLSDNIDTLLGYQRLIGKMRKNGSINIGFYWVLLKIIESYFYKNKGASKRLDSVERKTLKKLALLVNNQIKVVDKEMLEQGVERKKLEWLNKTLLYDFK